MFSEVLEKSRNTLMADLKWQPCRINDVVFRSYGVIAPSCGPQRKQF